jgi:hypothetical protein
VEGAVWGDPWRDADDESWDSSVNFGDDLPMKKGSEHARARSLHAAIVLGVTAARWGFQRTRHLLIAVLIGATVAIVVITGGSAVEAFLEVWCPAHDLLQHLAPIYRS